MLRRLYSIYAILMFAMFIPVMVIYYLLLAYMPKWTDRQKNVAMLKSNSAFLAVWEKLVGIQQIKEGEENVDANATYVFVGNHVNLLDITMMGRHFTHYGRALAKAEVAKIPLLGTMFSCISILVDRSNPESRKKSLEQMVKVLQSGCSIIMMPEGTRNRTDKPIAHFHHGAFTAAISAQVPILPFVLLGFKGQQPVSSWLLTPGKITMRYLAPIPTQGLTLDDVEMLKEKVKDIMVAVLLKDDPYWKLKS